MDFGLSEEQQLLEQTLHRFFEEQCPIARVREHVARVQEAGKAGGKGKEGGDATVLWKELASLGVAGILVPEDMGGSGLALLDAAVAAQSLGWGVAPAPFLGSGVMAPVAFTAAGTRAQQEQWLPRIATGECCVGIAATELDSRREEAGVGERGGLLHGKAMMVIDAVDADAFLVPVGDEPTKLAIVSAEAEHLTLRPLTTIDRTRGFGELVFEGVQPEDWIGADGGADTAIQRMLDAGRVVLAADALGACDRALDMAVSYAKQRVQFDRVIGSFQAVKHMCADMVAELEPARSLVWYAAHAFDAIPEEVSLMAAHAKAHLSEIGTFIVRTATEVHGGIGFTDEHNLHFWFKRVGVDRQILGTPDSLREHAAQQQGW
jgi:alkylation response protein AidB-like acyl-CoA dehydrogenase